MPCSRVPTRESIYPHRAGDILDLLFASVLKGPVDFALNLIVHGSGDANAAWVSQRLQASRDVDTITVHITIRLDNDIAKVHADTQPKRTGRQRILNADSTSDRFHRAC